MATLSSWFAELVEVVAEEVAVLGMLGGGSMGGDGEDGEGGNENEEHVKRISDELCRFTQSSVHVDWFFKL